MVRICSNGFNCARVAGALPLRAVLFGTLFAWTGAVTIRRWYKISVCGFGRLGDVIPFGVCKDESLLLFPAP